MTKILLFVLFYCLIIHLVFSQPLFTDVTEDAGIDHAFSVFQGTFGGGAAVLDYNNDGYEDLFITGGNGNNHLYKNNSDGTFANVSKNAGINILDGVITQGAVSADVNKDGYPDLFVTTIASIDGTGFQEARDFLLINNGDGTFSDRSDQYGFVGNTFSTGATFGDVNRDGYPDLYVSNYFRDFSGQLDQYNGNILNDTGGPSADLLYINQSGATFTESSELYGMDHIGFGFQGVWSDIDNDRDLDLLIANDFGDRGYPNRLYRNEYPRQEFTDISVEMNFDFGINGMGIGVGDYDMDGWIDYAVTNIQKSPFFVNQGLNVPFLEKAKELGSGVSIIYSGGFGVAPVSWGVNFLDADLDMDMDLYIVNGCLNPVLTPNPNLFFGNVDGQFLESGYITNTNDVSIGRGSVVFDYDNDGDQDILVVNQTPYQDQDIGIDFVGTRLYRNENTKNNWLKVKLEGRFSETSGIGSRVEVYAGSKMMIREIDGGSGHESQNSTIAHFGLGTFSKADSVKIRWSMFGTQTLYDVEANHTLKIREDITLGGIEPSKALLSVYPVPFYNELFIRIPEYFDIKRIEMLDLSGNAIHIIPGTSLAKGRSPKELSIHMDPDLPKGTYILRVTTNRGFLFKKIIK